MFLGECDSVHHYVGTKTPKIVERMIEVVSIAVNHANVFRRVNVGISAMKDRNFMMEGEESLYDSGTEKTCSPKNEHTHGVIVAPGGSEIVVSLVAEGHDPIDGNGTGIVHPRTPANASTSGASSDFRGWYAGAESRICIRHRTLDVRNDQVGELPSRRVFDVSRLINEQNTEALAALEAMADATRFNQWMADTLSPYIEGSVLEIGAGIGNLTSMLHTGESRYVGVDLNEQCVARLATRLGHLPNLVTLAADAANASDLRAFQRQMDTVICLNVLEHIEEDVMVLRNMYSCLRSGGRALILVPQGMRAFGTMDEMLQHCRRYSRTELERKMISAGFCVERIIEFNRITYPGWILNGRILRRRTVSRAQLRWFDRLMPVWRRVDRFLPWPPTSLIAVAVRNT